MQKKKLKKLLHAARNNKKKINILSNTPDKIADDHLKLNYVTYNQIKSYGMTSSFNKIRRQNVKEVLNKFNHPDSQHIRLKPYYDSNIWLHWIGVLSDLTLPNTGKNLYGEVLLDKLTTGDYHELLDYHVWLNLENVKYIKSGKQKIGIGDIVEGYSKIKRYSHEKYGLDTTIIEKAGIYKGVDQPDILVSNYDRQDDWVIEINNSDAGTRAWQKYQETHSRNDIITEPGHIESRYQPSRYDKYRERLLDSQKEESEEVLPLISDKLTDYQGIFSRAYIVKNTKPNLPKNLPRLQLKQVKTAHGRLVAPVLDLPYVDEIRKIGELQANDMIHFQSSYNPNSTTGFGLVTNFRLDAQTTHSYIPLPESANTFLGYLMWLHPDENVIPELVLNYRTWSVAHGLHTEKIKDELIKEAPANPLSEFEFAQKLGITAERIANAYKQGVIKPVVDTNDIRKYDSTAWNTFIDLLSAQDVVSTKLIKEKYHLYNDEDIATELNIPIENVRKQIKNSGYQPLNGLHYKVNLYGQNVYNMFKTKTTAQSLLPPKNLVHITKEIPNDISYVKKFEEAEPVQEAVSAVNDNKKISTVEEKTPIEKIPESKEVNTPQKTDKKEIKFVTRATYPEDKQVTQTANSETEPKDASELKKQTILIQTFDDQYLDTEFISLQEANKFIESTASDKYSNHFLHAKNNRTGKIELISTKIILRVALFEN